MKNQFLFTTIPYDEGWQAYIDGKRVDVERTGDGFLALWPDAGEHDIVLRFVPEGFRLGIIISIAGWIIYIIVFVGVGIVWLYYRLQHVMLIIRSVFTGGEQAQEKNKSDKYRKLFKNLPIGFAQAKIIMILQVM